MTELITSLEQLHTVQLEALREIDRVCRLHNIRWFLHGGTLLGALRHGGPIPWDDDVDIAMFRSDYNRFIQLALADLNPRFVLDDHRQDTEFFDFVPRITDTAYAYEPTAEYAEKFEMSHENPDVDIFVFDSACTGLEDKLQSLRLKANTAQAMGHRKEIDHDQFSGIAKIASNVLPKMGRRKPLSALVDEREAIASWGGRNSRNLRICNDIVPSMGFRYHRVWYEGERFIRFSGVRLPIPFNAEAEMCEVYGPTWRQLPAPEQRVPQHANLKYTEAQK